MKKVQQGFTLIELMIVVAIIGILAAIALPAYQDYTVRAKVSEAAVMASGLKVGVTDMFADSGEAGIGDYAAEVAADIANIQTDIVTGAVIGANGEITLTLAGIPQLGGANVLQYVPRIAGAQISNANSTGTIDWVCDNDVVGTTIADNFLPAECR